MEKHALRGAPAPSAGEFRPDIDVLRAIAVAAVICFHWNIKNFTGGFVGVDIFFVISGFLITRQMAADLDAGRFSFAGFYERRARRILPALYTVILVSTVACWFLLLPPDALSFTRSAIAITLFGSNILFWFETGYFDASALTKPLLHTWSLAVEEQFYLAFPFLLLGLFRWRLAHMTRWMMGIAVLSFAFGLWQLDTAPSAAFYLPFGRAWEFLLGALLAVGALPPIAHTKLRGAMLALGSAMLATAIFGFSSETPFPGWAAILPAGGTALCIWGNTGRMIGPVEHRLTVVPLFIGKISYSLYLWHWPAWVFAAAYTGEADGDFSSAQKLVIVAALIVVSTASYYWIETPFPRLTMPRPALYRWLAFGSLSIMTIGAAGAWTGGFSSRLDPSIAALSKYATFARAGAYRERSCFLQPDQPLSSYDDRKCGTVRPDIANVLLIGDSVAAHYYPGLHALLDPERFNLLQANSSGCRPFGDRPIAKFPNCVPFNQMINARIDSDPPEAIIISAYWRSHVPEMRKDLAALLEDSLRRYTQRGIPVIMLGPSLEYSEPVPSLVARLTMRGTDVLRPGNFALSSVFDLDRQLETRFREIPGLTYVSVLQSVCSERRCPLMTNGVPLQWDRFHLTAEGSQAIVAALAPQIEAILATVRPSSHNDLDAVGAR